MTRPLRLSQETVDAVRTALEGGMTRKAAVERFGLPDWTIRNISLGRTRGHGLPPAALAELWTPACMDPDEVEAWRRANRSLIYQADQATRPCADCPLGFALEMRAVDRCNGTPAGVHDEDELPVAAEEAA